MYAVLNAAVKIYREEDALSEKLMANIEEDARRMRKTVAKEAFTSCIECKSKVVCK